MEMKQRKLNRLEGYDYSKAGVYFVTICVHNGGCLFGNIVDGQMKKNYAGQMIDTVFQEIPQYYHEIHIDEYTIMPNHLHAIVVIESVIGVGANPCVRPNMQCVRPNTQCVNGQTQTNGQTRNIGQTQGSVPTITTTTTTMTRGLSLSGIIQRVKTLTTKKYIDGVKNNNWIPFNKRLWQRSFYDCIIRNEQSLDKIREYIKNNPLKWELDVENKIYNKDDTKDYYKKLFKA